MPQQLTAEDARQSLGAHVAAKGMEICAKYGPGLGWQEMQRLLQDRAFVRYPCEIVFDASPLNPGEFAHPVPKGDTPEAGFSMHVHPLYMLDLARVPYLVLYQLVAVNYGVFASPDDAEIFASHALGLPREEYYETLCALADQLTGEPVQAGETGDRSCGCACG